MGSSYRFYSVFGIGDGLMSLLLLLHYARREILTDRYGQQLGGERFVSSARYALFAKVVVRR